MKKIAKLMALVAFVIGVAAMSSSQVEAKESKDYVIKVNVGTNCVTIYKNNKPVKAMICSPSNETPIGTFYTPQKYRWHEMIGNCYAQYCTRIAPQILFHSVWYYKNGDKSTMSVSAYNVMGSKASHGCVRLLCIDAKWIYDNCALGTKVVIFKGTKKDDPLGRPSFTPIKTGAFMSWDPTDPDPKNPYQKKKPVIEAKSKEIEYKSKVTAKTAVEIKDCLGNELTSKNAKIKIKGKINTKKLGTYKVKYTVTDSMGNKKVKTIKFKVVDTKKPKIYKAKSRKDIAVGETRNLLTGVKAKTIAGKDITSKIKVTVIRKKTGKKVKVTNGNVKFSFAGKYKVTYKVTGNNKKTAKKTVTYTVVDKHVKVTMTGVKVTVDYGSAFNALSYIKSIVSYDKRNLAIDNKNVKVSGKVDTKKPGTYTLVYTISENGNVYTEVTKNLTVVVKTKPEEVTTTKVPETTTVNKEETTTKVETTTAGSEEETTVAEETTNASEEVTTVQ